jgi:hypothetical protein
MADYYSLLSRAVQGLDKNTSDARRQLYDKVRTVMMEQLHEQQPMLSDLVKQQLALEEAIKKIETEEDRKERSVLSSRPPLNVVRGVSEGSRAEPVGKVRELAARAPGRDAEKNERTLNTNRLPTDGHALFLACESIRQEAGGKLTIIGAVALTARHPIKPTSPRCPSAWQSNLGRRSTYRRGKSVHTTGATSDGDRRMRGVLSTGMRMCSYGKSAALY